MAASGQGIKSAKVSPAFLHTNSTIHTTPFSAIAELIDNAYDPDVNASELWIDTRTINGNETLSFVDNGNGLNHEKLYKMLSFGYCEKVPVGNVQPIGFYGNGFKSGSMRLGKDALVFTRCTTSMSVGFLSQTYLKAINVDEVLVPIVTWDLATMTRKQTPEMNANLKAILNHSIFKREKDLYEMLKSLENMHTGTNIIIYNLWKDQMGNNELDFVSDPQDIRNPESTIIDLTSINRPIHTASPEYKRSLREYCSILYLKPKMKIVVRGVKVRSKLISKSLSQTERDVYKPTWLNYPVKLIFGFTNSKEPENYGMMLYHKNRLIKAYEKVGCQSKHQANDHGVGVVGVVEANFLEPVHNKQDFNRNDHYKSFIENCGKKLNDYYYEKTQSENPDNALQQSQLPDWLWAQCDNCLSWRRLPTGYSDKLPDKWYCKYNPDAAFNRCDIPEEPEDDDEALQVSYKKTYKKQQEEKKRQVKMEEERRAKEKEFMLKQKEIQIEKKMHEIKRQTEELSEVSSSQDRVERKPTVADLERTRKSLLESQKKLQEQQKTIQDLEAQKQKQEQQKQALLRMAENLRLTSEHNKELTDKIVDNAGPSNSTVSSSSHTTLRAPVKRKGEVYAVGPDGKKVKVKQEKDDTVSKEKDKSVIDLTFDENEIEMTVAGVASNTEVSKNDNDDKGGYTEMEADIKPDTNELAGASKEEKKVFVQKGSQTVPTIVKFASPEEVNMLKLSKVEQKNMLLSKTRELDECRKNLKSLQGNIYHLLKIIVPDIDYGQPENIENVILDFIRVNGDQPSS